MKYDQAWLKRVNATKQLIPKVHELIAAIPQIQDRATVKDTFVAVVQQFEFEVLAGRDATYEAGKIEDLHKLAFALVNEPVAFG